MVEMILALLTVLAPIVLALIKNWLDGKPTRLEKERRDENRKIADMVNDGDAAGVGDLLRKWQREGS